MNKTPLEVVLYTRIGCHLCDDAKSLLQKYGLEVYLIDVDRDPVLAARYGQCVPVIAIDGRERFRGRVDEVLLRRLLRQRPV
ncbi:MAG TPA: glutaredoxin family protein [Pirellulales bacterium]|nr:glutaredoxin family protein [Pirellulales bacterium]